MYQSNHMVSNPDQMDWEAIKFFHEAHATFESSHKRKKDFKIFLEALDIICLQCHTNSVDQTVKRYVWKYGVEPIIEDKKLEKKLGISIATEYPYLVRLMSAIVEQKQDEKVEEDIASLNI